tara:strand:- start:64777 stop:65199 length:423 start_codon:yes stop_codon:yes gene_type:complete
MEMKWSRVSVEGHCADQESGESFSTDALVKQARVKVGNVAIDIRSNNGLKITARKRYSISSGGKKLHGFVLRLTTESDECFTYFIVDKGKMYITPLKKKLVEANVGTVEIKQIILKKNRPCEISFNDAHINDIVLKKANG